MDVSKTIADGLEACLSDVDTTVDRAASVFLHLRMTARRGGSTDVGDYGEIFSDALLVKKRLDELEASSITNSFEPTLETLALTLNCENVLSSLYMASETRHHPFLSHWVEAVQRLEQQVKALEKSGTATNRHGISWREIQESRLVFIQNVLTESVCEKGKHTPKELFPILLSNKDSTFALNEYIKMLQEEEIYERSQSPDDYSSTSARDPDSEVSFVSGSTSEADSSADNSKEGIAQRIRHSSNRVETAGKIISRLPVDLNTLELLTNFLQEGTLESLHVDSLPPIRDYIQHGLRQIEKMGQRQATMPNIVYENGEYDIEEQGEVGREAQTRSVKLLILFLRNLVRKALIPPEELYYEIQEVCVRYLWIREVRDFQAFMEGMG